ncbi:MAG: oxygen-independent coproporphyrinogen III oxidase [Bacteroidia bacterium]
MSDSSLFAKYNIPGPRYTSYPTVPFWETTPSAEQWAEHVRETFQKTNLAEGISLYIHLPFCESLCTYCGCNTRITINHAVEEIYANALLKEWSLYIKLFNDKPRFREMHLGGGTPTFFSPENLKRLISGVLNTGIVTPDAALSFEAHPNNTTVEHLQVLHALGFKRISIGVQDLNRNVQEIVNRIQPFEAVKTLTEESRKAGFDSVNFDLIYGLPLQTQASIVHTIEKVIQLRPDRIAFYSYAHVPWIKPGQRKFTEADLPKDEEKLELYKTGRALLEEKGYKEIGMDHFALVSDELYQASITKKLHRNFMGYTPFATSLLIGLGASSISDTWTAFAQNEKKVEDYYKALKEDRIPFFRGHRLTAEDMILRRHILNIMCYMETSWKDKDMQVPSIPQAVNELKEMEEEGLVKTSAYGLKVPPEGLPFIRNICMAFDARLKAREKGSVQFSKTI